MKWVTVISCLFLLSFAESRGLPRRARDVEIKTIKQAYELTGEDFFDVLLILNAQQVQQASYEEIKKLADNGVELAKKCTTDESSDKQCSDSLTDVFCAEICHEQALIEKYGFTQCCAKEGAEEEECFHAHKNGSEGAVPPIDPQPHEVLCKEFHDNKAETMHHFEYEVARRRPFANVAEIHAAAHRHVHLMEECCKAEDKDACFYEKSSTVGIPLEQNIAIQKVACHILKHSKAEMYAMKLANLAQKFPKAENSDLEILARDIVLSHDKCCNGHEVECLLARGNMVAHVCSHQEKFSSKVHHCCEKPWLERVNCFIKIENDEKPADLSPTVREFIEGKKPCQDYADSTVDHLDNFIYEYARRHPEFSGQLITRTAKGYKRLLERCCAMEHPETCLPEGEEMLKKHVAENLEVVKKNCDAHSKLGDYFFQNGLLTVYTMKAPQLEAEELLMYTRGFVRVANKCCNLDEGHKLKCAEENMGLVLGSICLQHNDYNINKQVGKCCTGPYDDLRECFGGLGVDPEYHAPAFNADLFHLDEGICTDAPEEAQRKKQTLLINMIKTKPDISEEQLVSAIVDFQGLVTNCCEADNHKACFDTEFPKLIEKLHTDLGVH
ncbi:alpha-fetoprotein-like [Varanus komodoensis]|uniref:alpha-fetoprotein-like n=1 Tax=Varanus komodoensis TaxID=61221 RepID=UPI001CF7D572|nr:alpha-fetoprotein-like [Varanus komodoensis]